MFKKETNVDLMCHISKTGGKTLRNVSFNVTLAKENGTYWRMKSYRETSGAV